MRVKMGLLAICIFSTISCSGTGTGTDEVKRINALVAAMDDSLKTEHYAVLTIAEQGISEGVPPIITFYFDREKGGLAAAIVSVGHESWSNEFRYYFYPDGKPMKYTKAADGLPDNPPKKAILFDRNGKTVWKNTEEPQVAVEDLRALFKKLEGIRTQFSEY
jgi:hypothetical protein